MLGQSGKIICGLKIFSSSPNFGGSRLDMRAAGSPDGRSSLGSVEPPGPPLLMNPTLRAGLPEQIIITS
jgi:hypothetical protein